MNFEELKKDIIIRSEQYSKNSSSHKTHIGEAWGFSEGVNWTLLKLHQLGCLKLEHNQERKTDQHLE